MDSRHERRRSVAERSNKLRVEIIIVITVAFRAQPRRAVLGPVTRGRTVSGPTGGFCSVHGPAGKTGRTRTKKYGRVTNARRSRELTVGPAKKTPRRRPNSRRARPRRGFLSLTVLCCKRPNRKSGFSRKHACAPNKKKCKRNRTKE